MLSPIFNYFCAFTAFILLPNIIFSDSLNPNAGFPTRVRVRVTHFTHTLAKKKKFNAENGWGDMMRHLQAFLVARTGLQIPKLHEMCRET